MRKISLIIVGFILAISMSIFAGKQDELSKGGRGRGDCGTCTDMVPKAK